VPDLFDEVNEDLRAERMRRLATRYGGLFVALALLVILGVAGQQGWRWWQQRQAEQTAAAFLAATTLAAAPGTDGQAAADRFLRVAADAPAGYATLARLRAAALKAEAGDRAGALALWDGIARDAAVVPLYRDLATLLWGLHALDAEDPALIETRLAPLARGDGIWRHSAQELAGVAALRRGATAEAQRLLGALAADQSAPEGVRQRAGRLLAGIRG
jgi:hypothetical protein